MPTYSFAEPVVATFVILPIALLVLLLVGVLVAVRREGRSPVVAFVVTDTAAMLWMAATWAAASQGMFREWEATPPLFLLLVVGITVLAAWLALSSVGRALAALPLWVLIVVQAFRLPLEIAMHELVGRGIMPVQMSYSGRNFDIITGASALVVAALVRGGKARGLAWAWNVMGLLLVLNVATVGIASTPRFRLFGDDNLNVFVTYPPFVWLPAVMVLAALAGHLVIFRALSRARD
ncbi:MAG: hypothetical protein ABL986_10195 [Vicinamibacterales bacterium]